MSEDNQDDAVDFKIPFRKLKNKIKPKTEVASQEPKLEDVIPIKGPIDSEEYHKFPKKGKCYIFNHKIFKVKNQKVNDRDGTDEDCSALKDRFTELGFEVEIFENKEIREVENILENAGKKIKHDDYTCFVCCILTHGAGNGFLYAKNGIYPMQNVVFEPFQGDKCPSLVDKPKLFFIQACQGDKYDGGVLCKETLDAGLIKIPVQADFLIALSTVPGYVSWRSGTGSWFIQSLCSVLKNYVQHKDILQMLTIVCRRVSYRCSSTDKAESNLKTQIPCITSTLRKDFRFA